MIQILRVCILTAISTAEKNYFLSCKGAFGFIEVLGRSHFFGETKKIFSTVFYQGYSEFDFFLAES